MKKLIAGLAALLLTTLVSACYESDQLLLSPAAAQRPLSDDEWSATEDGKEVGRTLTLRSDGWYDYAKQSSDGSWETYIVLLNALDGPLYAYAVFDSTEGAYVYGVVKVASNGGWWSAQPDCTNDEAGAIATRWGAAAQMGCRFTSASALFGALREYADTAQARQLLDR
jgi:hypothetical protein